MGVNIPGLIGVTVFYIIILIIGLIAGRKKARSNNSDTQFLADRGFGLFVASFTLSASMVGGAYINGTAEAIGRDGLVWTIAPVAYNVGVAIAGLFVAPKVRREGYTTIFDPLQIRFGKRMGALLFFNELLANIFWEAAILGALGTSLSLILDIDIKLSVIVSACVAVIYTIFGGLYSVAYTDIIQLIFITVGLVLALPFAYTSDAVNFSRIDGKWFGSVPTSAIGVYLDVICLCVFGAIPWQVHVKRYLCVIIESTTITVSVCILGNYNGFRDFAREGNCSIFKVYYQRVCACRSPTLARNASLLGTLISVALLVPPAIIGVVGSATDWNATSYSGDYPLPPEQWASILPMVLQYLCPVPVSVIGLGAISAAVMSSADSLILASGSVMARNVYKNVFRPKASDREVIWVLRISIVVVAALGTIIALTVRSVYGLFILCGDMMYVAHFPQVICALWLKFGNAYGSLTGFIVGFLLRLLGGEKLLGIPDFIKFPFYDFDKNTQLFPYKTFAMLCTFGGIISVSFLTNFVFTRNLLSRKYDIFSCFNEEENTKDMNCDKEILRRNEVNLEPIQERKAFLSDET